MSRIKTLTLTDFQCHKHLEVNLGGITALVGPSDHGKSAVVRALYWLAFNEPAGIDYRRTGAKAVAVTAKLEDGRTITRLRSSSSNWYMMTEPGSEDDGTLWDRVGRNVPPEISEALGLRQINFQLQHDSPYLIGLRPSEAGRTVNELVDLSLIDSSLRKLTSDLRVARADAGMAEGALLAARADIAALEARNLPARQAQLQLLQGKLAGIKHRTGSIASLTEYAAACEVLVDLEAQASKATGAREALEAMAAARAGLHLIQGRIERLLELGNGITRAAAQATGAVRSKAALVRLEAMDEIQAQLIGRALAIGKLGTLLNDLAKASDEAADFQHQAVVLSGQVPDRCPTCGQVICKEASHATP